MRFTIWIVSPENYPHSKCFEEAALSLRDGLRELRHDAEITISPPKRSDSVIILGGHLLHPNDIFYLTIEDDGRDEGGNLRREPRLRRPIVWQLEQIPDVGEERASLSVTSTYLGVLELAEVWDYSERNIELLAKHGVAASMLPVGYAESLARIANVAEPDIDVLMYGSMNPRRQYVLELLRQRGVNVEAVFDCYGAERDALIARSKIVINIHYYESKCFEIVRCSYLFANRKCVVSETGYGDLGGAAEYAPYDGLVETCVELLKGGWWEVGQLGFEVFSKMRQAEYLEKLVGRA